MTTEVILCATVLACLCWVIFLKIDIQALKTDNDKLRKALKLDLHEQTKHVSVAAGAIPRWGKKSK